MGKSITGILHIQGWWKIEHIEEKNNQIHLYFLNRRKTADCPRCKRRTKTGYDTQPVRIILHTTIGSQLVFLHIAPRRFVCSCAPSNPFREKLPGISGARSTSERFDAELMEHLSGQAFSTVTDKIGLTYPSQRLRLSEAIDPLIPRWDLVASLPEIHLGLDEHHVVNKKFVESITEVKQRIPLAILPNNRQTTVRQALSTIPDEIARKVVSIALDMDNPTIFSCRKIFPNAAIVIDHFHVIQDATRRLDEARRIEQEAINYERGKKGLGKIDIPAKYFRRGKERLSQKEQDILSKLFIWYPRLKIWHELKEQLREVYKLETYQDADKHLQRLILLMRASDDGNLIQWANTLSRYKKEILNYFIFRTTNAYTEGLNVRCKLIQRISSGFRNIDVYIRKAMLVLLPLSVAVTGTVYIKNYPLPLS